MVFDHWQTMVRRFPSLLSRRVANVLLESQPGKITEAGGKVEALVLEIRKRKGLKPDIPTLDQFNDKL